MRHRSVCFCALLVLLASPAAGELVFQIEYTDPPGTGFHDPDLGAVRREALLRATQAWSDVLDSPVAVRIQAGFRSMGGGTSTASLGAAAPTRFHHDFGPGLDGVQYPDALADALAGADQADGAFDMHVSFNVDIDGSALGDRSWHYAQDNPVGDDIDFQTVAMHEIGHGLGFYATFRSDGTYGLSAGLPSILDTFLVDAEGRALFEMPADPAAVTGDVFFSGQRANAEWAKLDRPGMPVMFAPYLFDPASSLSHVDTQWFRGEYSLMRPWYDRAVDLPDNITLGMLEDMGWTVNYPHAPEPTVTVLLSLTGLWVLRRRRSTPSRRV